MSLETPNHEDFIPQNEGQDNQEISVGIEASFDAEGKPDRQVTELEVNKLGNTLDYMGEKYGEDAPQVQQARLDGNTARTDMIAELPTTETKNSLGSLSDELQIASIEQDGESIQEKIKLIELQIAELKESGGSRSEIYKLGKKLSAFKKDAENETQDAENETQDAENQVHLENNILSKDIYLNKIPQEFNSISHIPEVQSFLSKISILSTIDNNDTVALEGMLQTIDKDLGDGGPSSTLYKILAALKKEDEKNGNTEYFDAFTSSSLATIDPDFGNKLRIFENNYRIDNPSKIEDRNGVIGLGSIPTGSTENTNDGSNTIRTYISQDGSKTEIDTSTFPPKREVSLNGSEYKLQTETPMTDGLEEATDTYEQAHSTLTPRIHSLSNLIQEIPELQSTNIKSIKDYLLSMLSDTFKSQNSDVVQAIEGASSMDDLKGNKLMVLKGLKDKAEKELKDAEDEYQQTLSDSVDSYREMMSEKDDRTKEILKTLKDTGFDMLPQHVSDMLIAEIQSGQLIPDLETSFDPGNIDIANGQFGQSEALSGTDDLFIKNIVRFMNKILGLSPDGTDIDGNLVGLSEESYKIGQAPFTPAELRTKLIDSGVLLENGGLNIERARNSLKMDMSQQA